MPRIYNAELGRSASLGQKAFLRLTTDLDREWVDESLVGGGTGVTQLTGDVTAGPGSGSQAATIANDAVTYAKIQNISAASRLLGRGSTGGSGDTQEISLGSGMSMTGTTLSATGTAAGAYPDFTAPIDGNYAWINQGGASITATTVQGSSGLFLRAPQGGGGLRIRKMAAPGTPYTITAAFFPSILCQNFQRAGLCFRESSSGKIITFDFLHYSSGHFLAFAKWNSPTSFNADYDATQFVPYGPLWLRIGDDGSVNRTCSFSGDGRNWVQYLARGRSDFMGAADEVGYHCEEASSSRDAGVTIISWLAA